MLSDPYFAKAVIGNRVAAATEHLDAIDFCAAGSLIDVGANKGQFSLAFRRVRPHARIIGFEPLPEAAAVYETLFVDDLLTELQRVAISDREGHAEFHVADRADSSSLLRPGEGQARAFGVRPANSMEVPLKRLDGCIKIETLEHPVLLKIDVQGGELDVLNGISFLSEIDFVYAELSFVELYDGQPLFHDVYDHLIERSFRVAGCYNQVQTAEYGPTQVDVLFCNTNSNGYAAN